ncbi:unnamed protein product, partial [marine sediment metagenome]
FGRGWTHAYEIRMEEIASVTVRTDFFGGKHKYTRDADGLYSPAPYMHDWMESDYENVLEVGPGDVDSDKQIGLDGTVKHFIAIGDVRVCDYIEDRHEQRTNLAYDPATGLLDTVTDPSGRVLDFTWTNFGTQQDPIWRIIQVTAPLQTVTYTYYAPSEQGWGGEAYTLETVTLDPGGLARTTTYTYTAYAGENGLLESVTDTLGHVISYEWALPAMNFTGTVWVSQITEPGGVDTEGIPRLLEWEVTPGFFLDGYGSYVRDINAQAPGQLPVKIWVEVDECLRTTFVTMVD